MSDLPKDITDADHANVDPLETADVFIPFDSKRFVAMSRRLDADLARLERRYRRAAAKRVVHGAMRRVRGEQTPLKRRW